MNNQVSSDQLTPNFSSLVIEMKEKIFLLLSAARMISRTVEKCARNGTHSFFKTFGTIPSLLKEDCPETGQWKTLSI